MTASGAEVVSTEEISGRLRQVIERNGGASKVAKAAGVPISTISDYLKGMEMRISRGARIAEACGVSLDWLAFGRDSGLPEITSGLPEFDTEILDKPAHFWALYVSVRSAQFYFSEVGFTPSLRDVLFWIREPYRQALGAPDRPIDLKGGE